MNKILFSIYRILVPKPLRTVILKKNLRRKILNHFASLPDKDINEEQKEVLRYLENNQLTTFPYSFQSNYSAKDIEIFFDTVKRMSYINMDGKKLYFKKRWKEKRIRRGYSELLKEQDINSPHRYLADNFTPGNNDIVADIGAAEGNFALSIIEKVKKIYLFEYDREWIKALEATFAPWKEKVVIINKYVADYDDNKHIRFDTFYNINKDITFLKIDVDGYEQKVLSGCSDILSGNAPLKLVLCTYHKNHDERDFSAFLLNNRFSVTCSRGYIIYYHDKKMKAPYLRRGLIRASRG
jgi:hypothetical protein